MLEVAAMLLPTLRRVLLTAHASYGRLLDGELVSDEADAAWDAFGDDEAVWFCQSSCMS